MPARWPCLPTIACRASVVRSAHNSVERMRAETSGICCQTYPSDAAHREKKGYIKTREAFASVRKRLFCVRVETRAEAHCQCPRISNHGLVAVQSRTLALRGKGLHRASLVSVSTLDISVPSIFQHCNLTVDELFGPAYCRCRCRCRCLCLLCQCQCQCHGRQGSRLLF